MQFRFLTPWLAVLVLTFSTTAVASAAQPSLAEQRALAEERGDHAAAAELTRRQLADKPDDLDLLTQLARHQRAGGDLERAAVTLQRVAHLAGKASSDVLEVRGDIALAENRPADALSDFQLALRGAPDSIRLLEKIAEQYRRVDDLDRAAIYYENLASLREQSSDHMQLARTSLRRRDWNAMVDHLSAASALSKARTRIGNYERLFSKVVQLGRYDRAIKADAKDVGPLLDRAQLFHSCEFYEEALADARRAARIDSRAPYIRVALAHYYAAAGDRDKGAEFNVNTTSIRDSNMTLRFISELANYDRRVRATPGDTALLQERARLLIRKNQIPLAQEDIDRVLAAEPGALAAQLLRVEALERTSRGAEARQLVRQLAQQHPDDADVLQRIGSIQMEDGLYEEAIPTFEKILARRPGYEKARDSLTLCYKRLQRQPPGEEEPKG
ncbi:MAG: tetratricopeptide (TPR) repeat protein [Verrucomicrobiales bacterium]|jgi:tetratricopeptide (TPR) repeat protein